MHPLLVLVAFSLAAVVTYAAVVALLRATSVVADDASDHVRGEPPEPAADDAVVRGEHARG